VVLTQGGTTTITGTYPNFTISSDDQYDGTVTSVSGTGTVNGISLSGTVTSSGSLALGGTLDLSSPPTIGNTTANTGNFTTLTTSSTVTHNGGTANGVAYLNGSKVLTSGSTLTFDGAILGVNGVSVGRGAGSVATNTAVGASALAANTTGANGVAIGYQAGYSNVTGNNVTAIGSNCLTANTASNNTAIGNDALAANTSGTNNVALGQSSMVSNTTGSENAAGGRGALLSNTTGSSNAAFGRQALFSNTTASNNTAVGYQAGYTNQTGTDNTFVGTFAGYTSNGGARNTALGKNAGYNLTAGTDNVFVGGSGAGYFITSGSKNSIIGNYNGNQGGLDIRTASNYIVLSDGDGNPRFGSATGNAYLGSAPIVTSGQYSTLTLTGAGGAGYISGSRNILYLRNVNASSNQSNGFVFGSAGTASSIEILNDVNANGTTTNQLNIVAGGTGGVFLASGGTSWSAVSDERQKDIIEPITDALTKVATLRTVIGKYKADSEDKRRVFLIAQEVQAVLPEAVTVGTDENNTLGLSYSDTIPLLVAAIKELKAEIDQLKAAA
jgi:hypothetical protein